MSNNLPLGAENDPRAPWNQPEPELIDLEVEVVVTISKKINVQIDNGYTNLDLYDTLKDYVDTKFSKEKNNWEVIEVDYEIIK